MDMTWRFRCDLVPASFNRCIYLSTSLSRLSKVHPLALSSSLYDPLYWEDCTREDVEALEADSWRAMVAVGVVVVAALALEVVEVIDVVAMDVEP